MTAPGKRTTLPEGLRDTNSWYADVDPIAMIDDQLVEYVFSHGGQQLLDVGCGLGGYAKVLGDRGRDVIALDVNADYVESARALGVDARQFDGTTIPLPDNSVDTVFLIEVLEHIPQPESMLPELARVARHNVIITVPNCTYRFSSGVAFTHMLEVDHKNFFTASSLRELLKSEFRSVDVAEVMPLDRSLAADLLPSWGLTVWKAARKTGLVKDRIYFRLVANARV